MDLACAQIVKWKTLGITRIKIVYEAINGRRWKREKSDFSYAERPTADGTLVFYPYSHYNLSILRH